MKQRVFWEKELDITGGILYKLDFRVENVALDTLGSEICPNWKTNQTLANPNVRTIPRLVDLVPAGKVGLVVMTF